ncbi:MAG: ribosome silencing factor, partial [Deltaproteobacteria bacterium]
SGRSTRHVQAIAEHIEAALSQRRVKPLGIEGLLEGHWVLLDLNDVVVHIFYHPVRAFYDLEGLWWEARQVDFSETGWRRISKEAVVEQIKGLSALWAAATSAHNIAFSSPPIFSTFFEVCCSISRGYLF